MIVLAVIYYTEGGSSYTYAANGNMLTRVEGGLTSTQIFYAENRLISVVVSGQTTQFMYDPDGSKTIYVGGIYEEDKTSGGTVTQTRTYYPAGGAMRVGSTLYYVLKDQLGSSSVVTDANGVTLTSGGEQRYYPFGEKRLTPGITATDKLFTGQRDTGLGIYYYGARFYSPYINRFLSADTIVPGYANPQALNRYSYTFNSPLNHIDPNGHDPWWCDSSSNSNSCYAEYTPDDNGVIGGHHHNNGNHHGNVEGAGNVDINVLLSGAPSIDIYVSGWNGNWLDINVPTVDNIGLEIVNPAPQLENTLFSKPKNKDKRPLTPDDIELLKGAGIDIHQLKGRGGGKRNLFKDRDGNIYESNYDGSGDFEPLNINLNNLGEV